MSEFERIFLEAFDSATDAEKIKKEEREESEQETEMRIVS